MKKIVSLLVALVMIVTLAAGCGNSAGGNNGGTVKPPAGAKSNPSESYQAYLDVKSDAIERITAKFDENQELYMSAMSFLGVSMVDMSLIFVTMLTDNLETSKAALGYLGMAGVDIKRSGNTYTITFKDPKSSDSFQEVCTYDPASDSMQAVISDGKGGESMFFEYVRVNKGYASLYYYPSDDGKFAVITSFLTDNIAAFGMQNTNSKPASVIGNNSLTMDFVKGGESYFILDGDKLTIMENGEEKTY